MVFDPTAAVEVKQNLGGGARPGPVSAGKVDRREIVALISNADEGAMSRVIFVIEMNVEDYPSPYLTLAQRRAALLHWASASDERVQRLADALRDFVSREPI